MGILSFKQYTLIPHGSQSLGLKIVSVMLDLEVMIQEPNSLLVVYYRGRRIDQSSLIQGLGFKALSVFYHLLSDFGCRREEG